MPATGEVVAEMLLRAIPPTAAEKILGRVRDDVAGRLRAKIASAGGTPSSGEVVTALREFFDLLRIAERPVPKPAPPAPPPKDPVDALRRISPDRLARLLDGEPAPAVALLLSSLDVATAGEVLKRLPEARRADVAMRLALIGNRNSTVLHQLARAVLEKDRTLGDAPPEPTADEKIKSLAQMLRTLPRDDRIKVLKQIEEADAELADKVRGSFYQFEDLLRVTDRAVQGVLGELDIRTVAAALVDADERVVQKVLANLSSRVKSNLADETQLLGAPSPARTKEARDKFVAVIRRDEEAGKIQLSD